MAGTATRPIQPASGISSPILGKVIDFVDNTTDPLGTLAVKRSDGSVVRVVGLEGSVAPPDITGGAGGTLGVDSDAAHADHTHGLSFTVLNAILAAAAVDIAINNRKMTVVADATNPQDAVNLRTLQSYIQGIDHKASVRIASTGPLTLSGEQTIDGVLTNASRILVKDQVSGIQNGIYITGPSGWTRATDMAAGSAAAGFFVFIEEGTQHADNGWVCTSNVGADVVGINALSFVQFSGAGQITAGAALTKTGNTLDVAVDGTTIEISADALRVKDAGIANAKLANMGAATVKGSVAGGVPADLTPAQVTTNFVVPDGSTLEISANQVRVKDAGVTNAKLANMAAATFKGSTAGGVPSDLTAAQATALLALASASAKGLQSSIHFIKTEGIWKDVVADFGADPAGVIDATTIIQTAVDSFGSGGGVLYFPAGTYKISGTITVSKPVILMGAGRSISVVSTTNATLTMFLAATGAQGMGFEQMRLSASAEGLRTAGHAFDMAAIANVYMQQCDILFQWSSVRSAGPLQFIDDVNAREGGENAINGQYVLVEGTGDRYIRRLTTDGGPGDATGLAGVRVRQCSSCVISDCNIINAGNALDIVPNGGAGTAVASILAMNTFFDSSAIGVNILPATATDTAHRMRFTNCWFGSNTVANFRMGNGTIPNANIASVDIIGCDFFSAGGTPVPFGLDVQGATDWSVRASRFGGHTTNAIRVAVGTGSADHRFSITDNLIANCLGGGANAQGITVGAGTYGNIQILDNRGLDTNTTPGMVVTGGVGPTGQINVDNNMGCVAGPLQALASGGGSVLANAGRGVATAATAETFLATFRIPANSVQVGDVFQLTALLQSSSTGTFTARVRVGTAGTIADALVNIAGVSAAGAANSWVTVNIYVYIVALGPTATVGAALSGTSTAAAFSSAAVAEAPGNVPTTAPWFISFCGTASVAGYTVRNLRMRLM